jgi:hypothetical protein
MPEDLPLPDDPAAAVSALRNASSHGAAVVFKASPT